MRRGAFIFIIVWIVVWNTGQQVISVAPAKEARVKAYKALISAAMGAAATREILMVERKESLDRYRKFDGYGEGGIFPMAA